MIDKHAAKLDLLVDEDARRIGVKEISKDEEKIENRIKLERMDDYTLTLLIHQEQTQEVIACLRSKGIESFPTEEADSSFGGYDTVYIPTLHPDTDIIRFQKVLDDSE